MDFVEEQDENNNINAQEIEQKVKYANFI